MIATTAGRSLSSPAAINRAARAVLGLLLAELALVVYLATTETGWQSLVLFAFTLVCAALTGRIENRSRRGETVRRGDRILLGIAWAPPVFIALLAAGLWLPLSAALVIFTIALASILYDRSVSSRPMLFSLIPAALIPVIDLLAAPTFRIPTPAPLLALLPALTAFTFAATILLVLRQFAALSLRQKLVVSFLFLSLVPMAGIRYLYDLSFRQSLTESANQSLFSIASQTAGVIDGFIDANRNSVEIQARLPTFIDLLETPPDDPVFTDNLAEAAELIYSLHELNADSFLIGHTLIDRAGIVVLDTAVPRGLINPAVGENLFNDPVFFEPALQGIPYASPLRVPGGMETARITFGHVVENADGQPVGVFLSHYSAEFLQQLLVENEGLAGAGSYGVLFDENEIVLAHARRSDLVFSPAAPLDVNLREDLVAQGRLPEEGGGLTSPGFFELAEKLNNAARQPFFTIEDPNVVETPNQVATARLRNYPWLVAFFQPQEVFLAPLTAQTFNSLVLAGLISLGAIAVALLASAQLAGPILRLTEAAEAVSGGDLDVTAEVTTRDEVGTLAVAFNSMTGQLREMLAGLERIVAERTSRLEATNEVGRVASSILNRDDLIANIVDLIAEKFGFYYAAVFLVDEDQTWAVLQAATGDAGEELKARGHRLQIGGRSMVGSAISLREPRIALDAGEEPVRFDNPLLPRTRSEIALPLIVGDSVLGALDVQSTEPGAFGEQDIETLQTLAGQIAVALENAILFERIQRSAVTQKRMSEFAARIQQAQDVDGILNTAVREIAGILEASEITVRLTPGDAYRQPENGSSANGEGG
ncbi:MAG TPA: GAF domain-containing protein [Anaerolineales bacterium]|nr:GAF domain-containing protein [Anaerolineales bacterium]